MKRKITLFIAAAALSAAALIAAAFGDTSSASPLHASKAALVALRNTALGNVLVDARGHTLYLFDKDKHGRSACYGACASYWPPLLSTAKPRPGRGVHASLLGVTKTNFGAAWDAIAASGRAVEPTASDSGGAGGGYGGGYGPRR